MIPAMPCALQCGPSCMHPPWRWFDHPQVPRKDGTALPVPERPPSAAYNGFLLPEGWVDSLGQFKAGPAPSGRVRGILKRLDAPPPKLSAGGSVATATSLAATPAGSAVTPKNASAANGSGVGEGTEPEKWAHRAIQPSTGVSKEASPRMRPASSDSSILDKLPQPQAAGFQRPSSVSQLEDAIASKGKASPSPRSRTPSSSEPSVTIDDLPSSRKPRVGPSSSSASRSAQERSDFKPSSRMHAIKPMRNGADSARFSSRTGPVRASHSLLGEAPGAALNDSARSGGDDGSRGRARQGTGGHHRVRGPTPPRRSGGPSGSYVRENGMVSFALPVYGVSGGSRGRASARQPDSSSNSRVILGTRRRHSASPAPRSGKKVSSFSVSGRTPGRSGFRSATPDTGSRSGASSTRNADLNNTWGSLRRRAPSPSAGPGLRPSSSWQSSSSRPKWQF